MKKSIPKPTKPTVHRSLLVMMWMIRLLQKPLHQSDISKSKKMSNIPFTAHFYDLIKVKVKSVEDYSFDSEDHKILVRIYRNTSDVDNHTILFFHGGGFVVGGITSYDHFCRRLCKTTGSNVVSVDYRLAPEHRFPAAHLDAWNAFRWLRGESASLSINVDKISVTGDSAGGNLAAYIAFRSREEKIPLLSQILIYPVLDMRPRERIYYDQFLLGEKDSHWFAQQFLKDGKDTYDDRVSLVMQQNFQDLPPTMIIKAEYDHLNGEIDEFEEKLNIAGVSTQLINVDSTFHGFITMRNWCKDQQTTLFKIGQFLVEHSRHI